MTGLVLALILGVADPCATVEAATEPNVAVARSYRDVAASEIAVGSVDTAVSAYRGALANDPNDGESREALRRLCSAARAPDLFVDGIRKMDAGKYEAAAESFREARNGIAGSSAELLEGICRFELGEDDAARLLFEQASSYPPHRDEARLYLGLLALRAGAAAEAGALFQSAAANPALERVASDLARFARRDGRLVLSVLAESGWDSNVTLASDGTPGVPPESDGLYALSGAALFRPKGTKGPYVRLGGFLQRQMQLGTYDFDGFDAAAGWQLGRTERGAIAEYDYAVRRFGGASYLSAHRLLGSGWIRAGPALIGASYLARFESYAPAWSRFSGTLQRADLRASVFATRAVRIGLAYAVARDAADDAVVSWGEHGPRVELRVAMGRTLLGADAAAAWRAYDAYDIALSARREDTYLDAAAFAEWDIDGRLSLRLSLLGRRATSNVSTFTYDKLLPSVAIGYALGLSP